MLIRTLSLLTIALLSLAAPVGSAQADPPRCPAAASGFTLWDVDTAPYMADSHVDTAGNNNGWVCARELPKTFVLDGQEYQLMNFIDDHV